VLLKSEVIFMAKKRPDGDGMIRKRADGRWEGRIVAGHNENGSPIFRYVTGHTQKEAAAKLRQKIEEFTGVELTEKSKMTVTEWLDTWYTGNLCLKKDGRRECRYE
jgi:hypothetical protein